MPIVAVLLLWSLLLVQPEARVQSQAFDVRGAARGVQPGEVVRLTIDTATRFETLAVEAFGVEFQPYRVSDTRWQVLIGIDLDVAPGRHVVSFVGTHPPETFLTTRTLIVEPKEFRTRRLTVEPQYVEPPPDVADRIVREAERLNAIWASRTPERLWVEPFVRPVPDPPNSAFGSRSIYNNVPRSPHGGTDFLSPTGRPVRSPNHGRVVLAEDLYFTGGTVVVDHGLGLVSLFAHLSAISVRPGTVVAPGDELGRVGATGRVTGPHLHWTVRLNGTRVDPLSLVEVSTMPDTAATPGLLP